MMKHSIEMICVATAAAILLGAPLYAHNAAVVPSSDRPVIVAATKAQCKSKAKACARNCKKRFKTQRQVMSCRQGCRSKRKACESKAS